MTHGELTKLVRSTIEAVDKMGPGQDFEPLLRRLRAAGVVRNMHVGAKNLDARGQLEWYAGQILDVIESRAWFAVNSLVNVCDKFAPATGKESRR